MQDTIVGVGKSSGFRKSLNSFRCNSRGQSGGYLCVASGQQSGGVYVLPLPCDVLHTDVPGPEDGVRNHEVPRQLGIVMAYMAGMQDAFTAGATCSESPDDQHLNHHVISLALQNVCQWLVLLLLPFVGLNKGLSPVLEKDGDIYHHDLLTILVGHNDVQAQLVLAAWDNAVDRHGPC